MFNVIIHDRFNSYLVKTENRVPCERERKREKCEAAACSAARMKCQIYLPMIRHFLTKQAQGNYTLQIYYKLLKFIKASHLLLKVIILSSDRLHVLSSFRHCSCVCTPGWFDFVLDKVSGQSKLKAKLNFTTLRLWFDSHLS